MLLRIWPLLIFWVSRIFFVYWQCSQHGRTAANFEPFIRCRFCGWCPDSELECQVCQKQ